MIATLTNPGNDLCASIATLAGQAWFVRYPRDTYNIRLSGISIALV